MKLTSEKALALLNEARKVAKDDHWIEHSICVGNTASIIAKALNLDEDKAKALGYIHDIGGPTANFYHPACKKQVDKGVCTHRECIGYDAQYKPIYKNNDIFVAQVGNKEFQKNIFSSYIDTIKSAINYARK